MTFNQSIYNSISRTITYRQLLNISYYGSQSQQLAMSGVISSYQFSNFLCRQLQQYTIQVQRTQNQCNQRLRSALR